MKTRALWATMEDDRTWLENPRRRRKGGRRRRRGRGRFKKGSAAAKRYMASIRPKRSGSKRRRRRARRNAGIMPVLANRGSHMARRRRGGRRRYRRNPGGGFKFSAGGMLARLKRGVIDALYVTLGEAGAGIVPGFFPSIPQTGVIGFAVQGVTAIALGEVTRKVFKSGDAARFVVAGALAKPMKTLVRSANIPVLSAALSSYALEGYAPEDSMGGAFGPFAGVPGHFVEAGEAELSGAY